MAATNEVIRFMKEHAHEFANGFGTIRDFIENVYDYFGEGDYGFVRDFRGCLAGGWIRLANGSIVRAETVCDGYGIVKGWNIYEA